MINVISRWQPYKSPKLNFLEEVSLGTAVLTLLIPSLLGSTGAPGDVAAVVFGALLLLNFSVVAYFFFRIASLLFSKGRCGSTSVAVADSGTGAGAGASSHPLPQSFHGDLEASGQGEQDLEAQLEATEGPQQPHLTEGMPGGGVNYILGFV